MKITLVRPQMGENIGASARAMANFGLRDLAIVNPRDGWPSVKAADTAGKALYILDDARISESVGEAVANCQFVLATTARDRAMNLPVLNAREAMQEVAARSAHGQRCAVLFGAERTGLENEEIMLANAVVTIPVSPDYASLNLSHAVSVLCYEWRMAQPLPAGEVGEQRETGEGKHASLPLIPHPKFAHANFDLSHRERLPAPRAELEGLFTQLEAALDAKNFWNTPEKKPTMWRNIRASLLRADLTSQEMSTWRGIVRALYQSNEVS
jgi:tRNA/rRNA methyltransferase